MIALKLVFQSLASVAAVASCVGGAYKFMNADFDDHFLLVSAPTTPENDLPTLNLWDSQTAKTQTAAPSVNSQNLTLVVAANSPQTPAVSTPAPTVPATPETPTKTKQYLCEEQGTKKTKDNECLLYTIKFDETKKTTDLSKLNSFLSTSNIASDEVKQTEDKATLTTNKFFILKASLDFVNSVSKDGTSTIKLMSNSDTEKTKSYGTLTVHAKLSENNNDGKVNLAIAQVTKAETTSTSTETTSTSTETSASYTCHFQKNPSDKKSCVITKLNDPTTTTTKIVSDISFASVSIPTKQAASVDLSLNKFVLIQWTGDAKYSISELKDSTVVFIEKTSASPAQTKTTELSIKASIFVTPTSTPFTEVIII